MRHLEKHARESGHQSVHGRGSILCTSCSGVVRALLLSDVRRSVSVFGVPSCCARYFVLMMQARCTAVVVVVVFVAFVFSLNRSFYPTTLVVHPVSLLILHPREIPGTDFVVTAVRQRKTKKSRMN